MRVPIYQIDAFADAVFQGNPAAVCPLPDWLPDATLRAIAAENNLSETAFLIPDRDPVPLRWFTPTEEVTLCGHATLAAGYVLLEVLSPDREAVDFDSESGRLTVRRSDDGYALDFPAVPSAPVAAPPDALVNGFGFTPVETRVTRGDPNYLVIVDDEDAVAGAAPDLRRLEKLHPHGVAVSAPGRSADFVSRYFAPSYGIPEDPVTGSIHCALGPYWARRLGRSDLTAVQLSARRGRLGVAVVGDRVWLAGRAVRYLTGEILLPDAPDGTPPTGAT